jgi:uncharacterized membrane protein
MTTRSGAGRPAARRSLRPRRRLRASVVQALSVAAGLVLGILLPRVSAGPQVSASKVDPVMMSIGVGVVGVISVVFSLLFLVVQWSFANLTPRLNIFKQDPLVWRSLGFAVGVFVFCITAPLTDGNRDKMTVLVPALAATGVLVTLALIRQLQMKAFASVDLAPVLAGITARGRAVIVDLYQGQFEDTAEPVGELDQLGQLGDSADLGDLGGLIRLVRWPHPQTILQQVDVPRLAEAAGEASAFVVVLARIGMPLREDQPVAEVYRADLGDREILRTLIAGHERTFHQDPMFAFRLLADIALRALSPAVNDPATAVQALDACAGLLQPLASRDLEVGPAADRFGIARVLFTGPTWESFVLTAFGDTVECAARSAMVLSRARSALTDLAELAPAARRGPLERRAQRCQDLLDTNFPSADFRPAPGTDAW